MTQEQLSYERLSGDLHRHGDALIHAHPHSGPHTHRREPRAHQHPHTPDDHAHHSHGAHGHSHGLVDESIKRSRAGLRAVGLRVAALSRIDA